MDIKRLLQASALISRKGKTNYFVIGTKSSIISDSISIISINHLSVLVTPCDYCTALFEFLLCREI